MPPLEERPEYPYQNVRTKNFFWGDGDKVCFRSLSIGKVHTLMESSDTVVSFTRRELRIVLLVVITPIAKQTGRAANHAISMVRCMQNTSLT
jgi:hypothetical protein